MNNLPLQTTVTPRVSNSQQRVTATPGNSGDLVNRRPPSMDHIWETLTKSNAFLEKLQKNQTVAQAESHSNFVDIEKQMKNLKNSSRTTPQTQIPIFRCENISIITLEGDPIITSTVPMQPNPINQRMAQQEMASH